VIVLAPTAVMSVLGGRTVQISKEVDDAVGTAEIVIVSVPELIAVIMVPPGMPVPKTP
jgi:hypothetical protein